MKGMRKLGILLGALSAVLAGCASIVGGGSTQTLNIDSNPKGAHIFLGKADKDGNVTGLVDTGQVTPSMVVVSRKKAAVVLKSAGYKDTGVALTHSVNGWFFGNILLGGVLGSSIDSSTGAVNKYDKDAYFAEMQKN